MYDVIIIGGGPGGLTAAIYTGRSNLNTLVIEKEFSGGQMIKTSEIENYTGIEIIDGSELSLKMDAHAKKFGAKFVSETVTSVDFSGATKKVITNKNTYESKTVILAMGATPKKINVTGESEYTHGGVSYCATCDGAFYRNEDVAVIGGGNTAVEEAIYLSRFCKNVSIIHRRDTFRAEQALINKIKSLPNINFVYDSLTQEIVGEDGKVTGIKVKNKNTDEESIVSAKGVFIAIGQNPNSDIVADILELNDNKNIITNEKMETGVDGIYAIGDLRNTPLRQIITACGDGAIAAQFANNYISSNF